MDNTSANNMWGDYLKNHLEDVFHETPRTKYFCDNEEDANRYANLVKTGIKKTFSDSLLGLQNRNERLPKTGDYVVVTDWDGEAQCIIETTKVILKPFFSINDEYAKLAGEGDKSLAHWKKVHWEYYTRELKAFERLPRESMIVVCQQFEMVFKR